MPANPEFQIFSRIETKGRSFCSKFFFSYLQARVCFPHLVFSIDFYFLIFSSLYKNLFVYVYKKNWEIQKLSQSLSSRLSNLRHFLIAASFCFIIDAVQKSSNLWWLHLSTYTKIFSFLKDSVVVNKAPNFRRQY